MTKEGTKEDQKH